MTQQQKRLTLLACILGSAVVFVDSTVVNVALPALRRDLSAGLATQQWVVEGYLLTLGSLILIGGSLGDLFGRRRVFAIGVAGFTLFSLVCALAPSAGVLVVGRVLQGVAGALLVPSTLAIITATFDESERGGAIGAWTAWSGAAGVVGPLAGGVIVDAASWRWIFVLSMVPAAITLSLLRHLPSDSHMPASGDAVDLAGATLCALGLGGIVLGLIEQPTRGWGDPVVAAPLVLGVLLFAAFLAYEERARHPMLPLSLFRRRNFAVANAATLLIYAGLGAVFFLLVLFVQEVAGYSALEAGLAMLPPTVILFALSRRFGALADRVGPHLLMTAGPLAGGAGLILMLRIDAGADYFGEVMPALAVFGLGLAMTVAPLTATVLGDVEQEHAGIASGVNNAIARLAGLLAIAAIGAAVSAQFGSSLDGELAGRRLSGPALAAVAEARTRPLAAPSGLRRVPGSQRAALDSALTDASVSSFRLGIALSAVLVLSGALVSALGIRNPRRREVLHAEDCPGGAICGASRHAAGEPAGLPAASAPARAGAG